MKHRTTSIILAVSMCFAKTANAEVPEIQTPSPVIFLADNLDEADRLGWCIDTIGRGFSERLHAHSCKPQGGDVQFKYDPMTMQIMSVAYDGYCAAYSGTLPLEMLECGETPSQVFTYDHKTMTFRPASEQESCLAVGHASQSAGPYMSRTLEIMNCELTEARLKMWVVRP